MRFILFITLAITTSFAQDVQQTMGIPLNFASDAAAAAGIGLTHEAIAPCASGVNADPCNTEFDQNYWSFNRCQSGADNDCFTRFDEPCGTSVGHPGEWWLPANTSNMLAGNNIVNLSLIPIDLRWAEVKLPIPGVFIKHFTDGLGRIHPTITDTVGQGGLVVYANNNNYASLVVGTVPRNVVVNGVVDHQVFEPWIIALSKENGNYWSNTVKLPLVLDGPDGVNFSGTLAIDRVNDVYTFKYTHDVTVTPSSNWTTVYTRANPAFAATPAFTGFFTQNSQTSSTACYRFCGFVVTAPTFPAKPIYTSW